MTKSINSTMMDALAKAKGKWRLVPLFGLEIAGKGADSIDEPIWGDASLVSSKGINEALPDLTQLDNPSLPPFEHRVLPNAQCYIAVRRDKGPDAAKRSRQIATFLTACLFLRGNRSTALSLNADAVYWWVFPGQVFAADDRRLACEKTIAFCEQVAVKPITIDISQIRESWRTGCTMPLPPDERGSPGEWNIWKDSPIAKALMGTDSTAFHERIKVVSDHLNETCCVPAPEIQVLMAVTAMEMLIGDNTFEYLKKVLHYYFRGDVQRNNVNRLLAIRHQFVHQGKRPSANEAKWAARMGVNLAWIMVKVAALYADRLTKTHEEFKILLRTQVVMEESIGRLETWGVPIAALKQSWENVFPHVSELWSK